MAVHRMVTAVFQVYLFSGFQFFKYYGYVSHDSCGLSGRGIIERLLIFIYVPN